LVSFLLLCALCVLRAESLAQEFKPVADGVEYTEMTRTIDGQPVRMNLLRLDLTKVRLDVVHAMDAAIGTETVSSIAKRHGALAAINAGFFRLDKSEFAGDAAGVLQIDRVLLSESEKTRIAIAITNGPSKTKVELARLTTETQLSQGIDYVFNATGINRERKGTDLILYKPQFGKSTLTSGAGFEAVFNVKCRKKDEEVTETCWGDLAEMRNDDPPAVIRPDQYVVSAGANVSGEAREFPDYVKNHTKHFLFQNVFQTDDPSKKRFFLEAEDITNGVPQLIKNGKIDITWQEEKTTKSFVETRHPRTAVAKLKDGKFLMITVDGRSESSGGISLPDLAQLLLELGATDAMNLDGGGSTTMYLDGKVVNHPSDKEGERKVSDAILVTLRRPRQKHDR
jgi:exopolysaccharide biosynthesis protein